MKKNNLFKETNHTINSNIKNNKNSYVDINELDLYRDYPEILDKLLWDHTTEKYLLWCTNLYSSKGKGYKHDDEMLPNLVIANSGKMIKPRILKTKMEQKIRSKEMAEVFTPAWICNKQNNLIDEKWFNKKNVFNREIGAKWVTNKKRIKFCGNTWQSYVLENRLEITCGESPYIVSRYDVVNSECILPNERIGFLDRKIRVINENISNKDEWFEWVKKAFQHSYGFDFQGDNVLLARENLLLSFIDYYLYNFHELPSKGQLLQIVEIISWNIWQMDGTKFVVPNSCNKAKKTNNNRCQGCLRTKNQTDHNGKYCIIYDWDNKNKVRFIDIFKGDKNE